MSKVIVINATGGRELLWRHVKVRKSLDDICHTLELEIPSSERRNVRKHDLIEVRCYNPLFSEGARRPLVTTVRVDEVTASVDVSKHSAMVLGRSPARDIIDSTWGGRLWLNDDGVSYTLASATRAIASKFEIATGWFPAVPDDPTSSVGHFSWRNESPWVKLVTEAANQGFIITSNQAGGLYIWQVPTASGVRSEGFRIDEGQNVRSIEWRENGAEQFHEYVVIRNFETAVETDDTCRTNRTLTIDLSGISFNREDLQRRAKTEMLRRRENRTTVAVSGWGLTDSQIRRLGTTVEKELFWSPNFLIPVSMPSLGLSESLLIAEVEHEADAQTMQSTVTLVRREAYL